MAKAVKQPTMEEMKKRIAELEKQQAQANGAAVTFKVGDKGGVSVYGLGRFPVTLYYEQWNKLLASADELKAYMAANKSKLKLKT